MMRWGWLGNWGMDLLRVGLDRDRSCFGLGEGKDGGGVL